jgi:hypothetical protein
MRFATMAVWFTEPPGLVVQLVEPTRITLPMVDWLVGPAYAELERRYPRQSLEIVLDFAHMTSRTSASRTVFLSKARQVGQRFVHGFWVAPTAMKPAAASSIQASVALMRSLGIHVVTVESAAEAIGLAGMTRAP